MRSQNRLVLAGLIAVALFVFAVWSTPFVVANGVRLWLWWKARQQGLVIGVDKIEAPLLRPVVLRKLHITSRADAALHVDIDAPSLSVALNLKSILLRQPLPPVASMSGTALQVVVRAESTRSPDTDAELWRTLARLVPDSFAFEHVEVRFERGNSVVLLRELSLSANEIEAGRFTAKQVVITSPRVRQTFGQLRGATKWEERRLTLAGVTLAPGVDLPALTFDLSQLSRATIGATVDAELFGGTLRLDISRDAGAGRANWKLVGSANDISLAQAPPALGFSSALGGRVHACKFTLRGSLLDLDNTTGWIWTELRGLNCKRGGAEVLMLGAALYNRRIDVDQLYLKQSQNEVTVSGAATIPRSAREWMQGDLRLDLAASVHDMSELAGLLGGDPGDYSGELEANGSVTAQSGTFSGELDATGAALRLQGRTVDALRVQAAFSGKQVQLTELTFRHADDFLRAHGTLDLGNARVLDGVLDMALANAAEYLRSPFLPGALKATFEVHGRTASIPSLSVGAPAGDLAFSGSVDFTALDHIAVTLRPAQILRVGLFPESGCVRTVRFVSAAGDKNILPAVDSVALRRDSHSGIWSISLLTATGPPRSASVCRDARGQPLEMFVGERNPEAFDSARRAFHGAVGDPLSLLPRN